MCLIPFFQYQTAYPNKYITKYLFSYFRSIKIQFCFNKITLLQAQSIPLQQRIAHIKQPNSYHTHQYFLLFSCHCKRKRKYMSFLKQQHCWCSCSLFSEISCLLFNFFSLPFYYQNGTKCYQTAKFEKEKTNTPADEEDEQKRNTMDKRQSILYLFRNTYAFESQIKIQILKTNKIFEREKNEEENRIYIAIALENVRLFQYVCHLLDPRTCLHEK